MNINKINIIKAQEFSRSHVQRSPLTAKHFRIKWYIPVISLLQEAEAGVLGLRLAWTSKSLSVTQENKNKQAKIIHGFAVENLPVIDLKCFIKYSSLSLNQEH